MRSSRWSSLALLVTVLSLLLAACGGGDDEAAPAPTSRPSAGATAAPTQPPPATSVPTPTGERKIALASMTNFETIDPWQGVPRAYLDSMYDYIIGVTPDGKLNPASGFASEWSLSADAKVHTLKVKTNVVFHNGDKATSKDIAAGIAYGKLDRPTASQAAAIRREVVSVETPDDTTAIITLSAPNLFWNVARLSRIPNGGTPSYLFPGDYFEKVGLDAAAKSPIGSGPFKFKSVQIGDKMTFEATEKHWYYGTPLVKTLEYRAIPEENTRVALLRNGEVDLTNISRVPVKAIRDSPGLKVFSRDGSGIAAFRIEAQFLPDFNGVPNPLADVRVRQALALYGIDRAAIVDTFMQGLASPTIDYPAQNTDPSWQPRPVPAFDQAKAKALLKDAGFEKGFDLDMYIFPRPQLPEGEEIMEGIAVWWEQLGIRVKRLPLQFNAWRDKLAAGFTERPSVSGAWFLGNNPVAGAGATTNHAMEGVFVVNRDPSLDKLAKAWAARP